MSQLITETLPGLREDLEFLPAGDDAVAQSGWLIHDRAANRYFRIDERARAALRVWHLQAPLAVLAQLDRDGVGMTRTELDDLVRFLKSSHLLAAEQGETARLVDHRNRHRTSRVTNLVHTYLFFKLPLVRPQKFLSATLVFVRPLASPVFRWLAGIAALLGLYLASRQSDVFFAQFEALASWHGAVSLAITLALLKAAHELGHAYIATHYGCRVPTMGIAFMVLFPMLYSDVSDAWRLKSRRKRMLVDAGGVLVELVIGGFALLLWSLLPDGPARTIAFFLATSAIVMTLLVNLSPFMRFDGYHLLADALGVHNLQSRGFALGRWQARRWLFGLADPPPERFAPRLHRLVVLWAFATWVYRAVLFISIALAVYHLFFKALGVVLFVIEIIWFIAFPVWSELKQWWQRRADIVAARRVLILVPVLAVLVILAVLPLERHVRLPAILAAGKATWLHAPVAARVVGVYVGPGSTVAPGQTLIKLNAPRLDHQLQQAVRKQALVDHRLKRASADAGDRAALGVLLRQRAVLQGRIAGLVKMRNQLVIKAPTAGRISALAPGIAPGMWVNPETRLAHLHSQSPLVAVRALVTGYDAARLSKGAGAVFVPETPQMPTVPVKLIRVGTAPAEGRLLTLLAARYGGTVSMLDTTNTKRTQRVRFAVLLKGIDQPMPVWQREARGTVHIVGKPQSLLARFYRHLAAVVLRETGF